MSSPQVIVRNLRKRYGQTEAVKGVSFTIGAGEIFGLLGPNGAGKTSTLECLIGLREPDAGDREICGVNARNSPAAVKQKIGVALQSTSLPDKMTPREALQLFGSFYAVRAEPEDLLVRFNLVEKAELPFDALSGGQRQRLALALAFVNRPELIILDEPTTGLDPQARQELHREILKMKADGYTVLLSTHYLEEAERLCDRVAIMDHGIVVATGPTRELIAASDLQQKVVLQTDLALTREALAPLAAVQDLDGSGTEWSFRTSDATQSLSALATLLSQQKIQIKDLQIKKASLEDLFFRLTQERIGDGQNVLEQSQRQG
ncbi:MAG TPA: ABC transporter ATP-binding protein [Opitutaceae bacterium]|nr:ABC transporter ATP-binding protein [Opitutaceae bacterium]